MLILFINSKVLNRNIISMTDFKGLVSKFMPKYYIRFDVSKNIQKTVLANFCKQKLFLVKPNIRLNWWKNNFCTSYGDTALPIDKISNNSSISTSDKHFQLFKYPQAENKRAHAILENLPQYKNSVIKLRIPFSRCKRKSVKEIQDKMDHLFKNTNSKSELNNLINVFSCICQLSDTEQEELSQTSEFNKFTYFLINKINCVKDADLFEIISFLYFSPFILNNILIKTNLDDVCLQRSDYWSFDTLLKVFDWFFHLQIVPQMKFCDKAINLLISKSDSLNYSQLIHLMFCLNLKRKVLLADIQKLEENILKYIPQMSINELGIVCMGFFKTKYAIRSDKILNAIIEKTHKNLNSIDEVLLTSIIKTLRKSSNINVVKPVEELLNAMIPLALDLTLMCLGHISWLSYDYGVCNDRLLGIISEKLYCNIATARLKDLARITWSLSCLNFQQPRANFYKIVLQETELFKRESEFFNHPDNVIKLIASMLYQNIDATHLISKIMEPSFLKHLKDDVSFNVWRDLFFIHTTLEIEFPNYTGSKLPYNSFYHIPKSELNDFHVMTKNYILWSHQEKTLMDILKHFRKILGKDEYCRPTFIMPHFPHPELILHFDSNSHQPLPITEPEFQAVTPSWFVKKPTQHGIWVAVFFGNRKFYRYQTNVLLGPSALKLRQLKKIGYRVIEIPYSDYTWKLSHKEKQEYLKKKLDSALFMKM